MASQRTRIWQFGLRIVLPAMLILAGTVATVLLSLDEMAGAVNRIEEKLTERVATGALRSEIGRLGKTHEDYARWDDAVRGLYGHIEESFAKGNFEASTASPVFFDTAYLIDENGHDLFAYRNGHAAGISSATAFGPPLAELIAGVPHDGRTYAAKTGIVRAKWGMATIAVGPVVPSSADFAAPPGKARMLVIARDFNDAAVDRIGSEFVIDGLHLAKPGEPAEISVTDPTGAIIGGLSWPARELGGLAMPASAPS